MKLSKVFTNGIFKNNPIFVQLIGMCSVLAITNAVKNGIGMGLAVIIVFVGSNLVISLLRNFIPDKIRIPAYVVIIATFVTLVEMFMHALTPDLYESLGIFIPLIVVNCIILARAESFASKNGVIASIVDGLGMGVGYTIALLALSTAREILGSGTFMGIALFGDGFEPVQIFAMAPGAFILLGVFIAGINAFTNRKKAEKA